jgi:hypothetical protein
MRILRPVAIVIVVVLQAGRAFAGDAIVLESYTGGKTPSSTKLLSPVLEELSRRSYVAGSEAIGRKFESRVSRPAIPEGLPEDFAAQVDKGHKAWIGGQFSEAVTILGPLIKRAHDNTGAFAQKQDLRPALQKALIAMALSQQRMGDLPVTRATFAELLQSFPDTQLSRASYGPEAADQFQQMRKEIGAAGHGKLIVKVTGGVAVYINEKFENVGETRRDNLLAGEYRVFAVSGNSQVSRSHRAVIKPNEETVVTIDPGFDLAVQTSPALTGMQFATAADREKGEASYAASFANSIDAKAVAVIGIDQVKGRSAVIGVLVNLVDGKELRRASLPLDPDPSPDSLRTLARFLAGDAVTTGIDIQLSGDVRVVTRDGKVIGPGPERPPGAGPWGGWKYMTGGAAIAAFGVGTVLLIKNGGCATPPPPMSQCSDLYNFAVPGWATIGGGVVLSGITLYLILHHDKSPSRSAFITPTSGGAVASFSTRF